MGGYIQGQDKDLDDAILMWPKIINFISQKENETSNYEQSVKSLFELYSKEKNSE